VPVGATHIRKASAKHTTWFSFPCSPPWPAGAAALSPVWLPLLAGGMLGGLYSAANHIGVRRLWRSPTGPLRVVVTGGSTGIGKALAREFLRWVLRGWTGGAHPPVNKCCCWLSGAPASAQVRRRSTLLPGPPLLPCCCRSGDQVIVTSRSLAGAQRAVEQLREEVGPGIDITGEWVGWVGGWAHGGRG
jgi:hypothetical protein